MKSLLLCMILLGSFPFAQDTPSVIFGKVFDQQAAAVPSAIIAATHIETC